MKTIKAMKLAIPLFVALAYGPAQGLAAPILGSALASFAVLGATGVTSGGTGSSTIGGNLGSFPTDSITGLYTFAFGSSQPGTQAQAQIDLDAAILAVNAFVPSPANTIAAGNLNLQLFQAQPTQGGVISPGTYSVAAGTSNFDSAIILDGGGDNTAQWYFQFTSTLITGTSSTVLVQNVGDGAGVGIYWTVADAATLNGPKFAGNVLANQTISSDSDLTIACGRLLSAEAQVTLLHDTISIGCTGSITTTPEGGGGPVTVVTPVVTGPGGENVENSGGFSGGTPSAVPEPATLALLGLGLVGLGFSRRRHG